MIQRNRFIEPKESTQKRIGLPQGILSMSHSPSNFFSCPDMFPPTLSVLHNAYKKCLDILRKAL